MDPARLANNPPGFRNVVSQRSSSGTSQQHNHSLSGPASHQSTSLPSIRHLHPYLPPPGVPQSGEGGSYLGQLPFSSGGSPPRSSHEEVATSQGSSFGRGDVETEGDREQQGPPKKKRRRQALSCTECKRRKIKCDRNQPCGPCSRRNEQSKCQWHIVEPVEKYVTRAEYDDLKTRFDNLEAFVSRLVSPAPAPAPVNMPMYQMGTHAPMSVGGATTEASTSYTASPQGAAVVYQQQQPLMYQPQMDSSRQQQQQRYTKSDEIEQSSRYQPATTLPADSARSLSSPQALQSGFPSQSPTMTRHRPAAAAADDKSATSVSTRTSPLSLASITSPFNRSSDPHQHHQSKNYTAQTPILGERLRLSPTTSLTQQGGPENHLSPAVCRPLRAHPHPPLSATHQIYT